MSSASHDFVSDDIGKEIAIVGGSGFTVGRLAITGITGTAADLIGSAGTTGSSGGQWRSTFINTPLYRWWVRMVWLTGWHPYMWHYTRENLPLQEEMEELDAAAGNAVTRMGGSDHKGIVPAQGPTNGTIFNQKYLRLCADVGGKFLNAIVIRPDEYDGGNFVINGSAIDVKDAAGTTTFLTLPNASVIEEIDGGAWIEQTSLSG